MSEASYLAKNTAILAFGKITSQMIGFILLPLYTRYLSPTEYGFVDLALVYITLLVPAATLQLETALFRQLIDARDNYEHRTRIISSALSLTVPLILPWIIGFLVLGLITKFPYFGYIVLTGVSMLCANLLSQIARGLGDNKRFAIASMVTGVTTLPGALIFIVIMKMGTEGMLLSIALANMSAFLYLFTGLRVYKYVRLNRINKELQRDMLGYSIPLVPNGAAWWVISGSDRTIISIMINTAANGIYAVASKYSTILYSLFGVFSMSWMESASLHINSPDRDKFFSRVANAAVRLFGALGLGLIAAIPFIFPIMVDDQFHEAYMYIPVMVISVLFNVIVGIYSAVYIAKKLTRQVMNTSLIVAVINVLLTVVLIPFIGLYAAAIGTATAFLIMAIFRHYDVQKYVRIRYEKRMFLILALLYLVVITLYYVNTPWTSLIALTFSIIAFYWINKNELIRFKFLVVNRINNRGI